MPTQFKVAAVQSPAGQISGPVGDIDLMERLTARAARQGAMLVAWPECSYPAYFLRSAEQYRSAAARRLPYPKLMDRLAGIARRCKIHLVAGIVEERDDGKLSNAAMLFDPRGERLLVYRKCFLWHFDNEYFVPGEQLPVVSTELGRIGVMICADGRCPELAAIAGRQQVQLLVNPTAWVSWARRADDLTNPQIEYFIPARAMENGCWVLSANKVGVEADSIVYCGRSNLVDPRGGRAAALDSKSAEVLLAEVDLGQCRPAVGCPPPDDRDAPGQPLPPALFTPTASLPITRARADVADPAASLVAAAVAGPLDHFDPEQLLADLAAQSVRLVVAGHASGEARRAWVQTAGRFGMILCFAAGPAPGRAVSRLLIAGGRVDSFAPARAAMLNGAELFVAAPAEGGRCPDDRLLRARASENRIYVLAAAEDRALIVSPTGTILADSLEDRPMAVVATIVPAATRDKLMAPGTDVVNGRNPQLYARYLRPDDMGAK